jgi:hypothetical protein
MVDKIRTVPKTKIGARVGRLTDEDMVRLNRAVLVFLRIAAPASREQLEWSYGDLKQLLAYLCARPTRHAFKDRDGFERCMSMDAANLSALRDSLVGSLGGELTEQAVLTPTITRLPIRDLLRWVGNRGALYTFFATGAVAGIASRRRSRTTPNCCAFCSSRI